MSFYCKVCNVLVSNMRNNAFYCAVCREEVKKMAFHWELDKKTKTHIWIKNNRPVRVMINGEFIEPVFVNKETVD